MRDWLVGGAVIEGPEGLLLVRNRRRGGREDWTPPGGVIDPGESLLEGVAREVTEETGLEVTDWSGPLYAVTAEAPGLGWRLTVEVWQARSWRGELRVGHDPDGIVVEARFLDHQACAGTLSECGPPWVAEPVTAWLAERWADPRRFDYRLEGDRLADVVVTRR